MGYITCAVRIVLLLVANVFQVFTITTRLEHEISPSRNFRRHIGTLPFPDWELGLREAVYQALLRERNLHTNLREFLYSAPILGRQDSATPFGDIAILARGQLYSAPGGFQFVQDPYQNDCDGCHNALPRCDHAPCENWRPEGHERLLALWTVKRIRHRDSNYGYRYELEYKVSPMNVPVNEPFVTRNGRFDYSMPGHTFIVKGNPRSYDPSYQSVNSRPDKVYRSSNLYDSNNWSPNFGPNFDARYLPPPPPQQPPPLVEEYYDEDPRNAGYPNVLYGPPERYTKKPPYRHYTTKEPETYDDKDFEQELFKNLIGTLSSKTSTAGQAPLSTASTQNIYSPAVTSKTSPQPTTLTTSQLSSKTTDSHSSYHPTSAQAPLLPTIPIENSFDASDIFNEKPLTTHKDGAPIKPLFTPSMVRFPTTVTTRSTTPLFTTYKTRTTATTGFSESTRFVKYSEPDPLYMNSITPTRETLSSKLYPTRTTTRFKPTTRRYKTTESDDYDIFGEREETTVTEKYNKQNNRMKFPGMVNVKLPPGEQVIKVVNPPTIVPKDGERHEETVPSTERSHPREPTPKYQVNFNDTQQLQPNGEPYITIDLRPSTRGQQSSSPSLSTESSTWFEFTTKAVAPQRTFTQQSSVEPTTASLDGNIKSVTRGYTTLSTESFIEHEQTATETSSKVTSSATHETVPFTRTTGQLTRPTTPSTAETLSLSRRTSSSINPPSLPTRVTTKSTTTSLPLTRTSLSTKTTSPLTKTTYLSTSAASSSTHATQPSRKTSISKQRTPATKPVTRRYEPPTQPVETTIREETTHVSSVSPETTHPMTETNHPMTETTHPMTETTHSMTETTHPMTETTHPMTTESTVASTVQSRSAETTIIPTTSTRVSDFTTPSTVITTYMDTSPSTIPRTTYALPKSRKPVRLRTKSTLPIIDSTTPMSTTKITTESTTPIEKTSKTHFHSSTSPTTHLAKIPSQTTSSTTRATVDNFLMENNDNVATRKPKVKKPQTFTEDFEFDIFGKPQEQITSKSVDSRRKPKEQFNSKEIDDIFGSEPIKKQPVQEDLYDYDNAQTPMSTTNKVKIIYSDFYSPSASPTEKTTKEDLKDVFEESSVKTTTIVGANVSSEDLKNKTTEIEPLTSQSFSTSVSIEVNKKSEMTTAKDKDIPDTNSAFESTSKEDLHEKAGQKATTQAPCNTTDEKVENNKILDALALSVVNHAKSIDYLNSNNNDGNNSNNNNNNNGVRERRYKRKRTYRVQKIRKRI